MDIIENIFTNNMKFSGLVTGCLNFHSKMSNLKKIMAIFVKRLMDIFVKRLKSEISNAQIKFGLKSQSL